MTGRMRKTYARRVRERRGNANLARVRAHSMSMAADLQRSMIQASEEWEARVRADERVLLGRVWAKREDLRDAPAEAVAAKLAEFVCEQESLIVWNIRWREQAEAERDAARAERDRLDEMNVKMAEHVARHHAEVAALREQVANAAPVFVSSAPVIKVLADLRAKVRPLPVRAWTCTDDCPGRPGMRGICTCSKVALIDRDAVLALLEEAQP